MGCGSWTSSSWDSYKKAKSIDDRSTVRSIYRSSECKDTMNPEGVAVRESRDSDEHPNSNAIILGLDVTGSMGSTAETIAKGGLNDIITGIYDKDILEDPQIMVAAIGDTYYDESPLQVGQFESDIRAAENLTDIWFEGGGGGNGGESYLALWYFAARHTSIDCFEKRGKKGVIFTIGDEPCCARLPKEHIKQVFGDDVQADIKVEDILAEVSKMYDVYHIGLHSYGFDKSDRYAESYWTDLLGERAMLIRGGKDDNLDRIPAIINATLELRMGRKLEDITRAMDSSTALVVTNAVSGLTAEKSESTELVEF